MTDIFWLIPFIPALSTFILAVFGKILPKKYVSFQACLAVFASFVISVISFLGLLNIGHEHYPLLKNFFSWIQAGSFQANLSLQFDPLSAVMAMVVTGVGFLIHVYSVGYMAEDKGYTRYFTYLNLFTFAMLLLVMGSNIILMFVGWEGVGLCSYLLIGFWFERPSAAKAGQKAFIVNRIGDAGFLLGIFFIFILIGNGEFTAINKAISGGVISQGAATLIARVLQVSLPRFPFMSGCRMPWKVPILKEYWPIQPYPRLATCLWAVVWELMPLACFTFTPMPSSKACSLWQPEVLCTPFPENLT